MALAAQGLQAIVSPVSAPVAPAPARPGMSAQEPGLAQRTEPSRTVTATASSPAARTRIPRRRCRPLCMRMSPTGNPSLRRWTDAPQQPQ
jgi:hypothetical protein